MATFSKRINGDGTRRVLAQVSVKPFKRVSKYFPTQKAAEVWADDLERSLKDQRDKRGALRTDLPFMTLGKLILEFLGDPETQQLRYYNDLERLLAWWIQCYGNLKAREINVLTWREARDRLRRERIRRSRTNATVNRYLSAMRSSWNWARSAGLIPKENTWPERLMLTEPRARTRFLDDAELTAVLTTAQRMSPTILAAITVSIATGLRKSELLRLKWADIDFAKRAIRVVVSKNGEARTVHLPDSAAQALRALKLKRVVAVAVFSNADGSSLKQSQLEARWRKVKKAAMVEAFRWHDLRHTAASFLAQSGASLVEIGAVLGHRSPAATARYAHMVQGAPVTGSDKVNAKLLGALENIGGPA